MRVAVAVQSPALLRAGAVKVQEGNSMDKKLLDILVCPLCKGPLIHDRDAGELICKADRLAYPIRDDLPVMLEEEARELAPDEDVK